MDVCRWRRHARLVRWVRFFLSGRRQSQSVREIDGDGGGLELDDYRGGFPPRAVAAHPHTKCTPSTLCTVCQQGTTHRVHDIPKSRFWHSKGLGSRRSQKWVRGEMLRVSGCEREMPQVSGPMQSHPAGRIQLVASPSRLPGLPSDGFF